MQILGGDFGENLSARVETRLDGTPTSLSFFKDWSKKEISPERIASVTHVTDENKVSVLGGLGWGITGSLIAGPIGAVVGGLLGGKKKQLTLLVTLTSGKQFLADASPKEYKQLTSMAMRKKPRKLFKPTSTPDKPPVSPEDEDSAFDFLMDD